MTQTRQPKIRSRAGYAVSTVDETPIYYRFSSPGEERRSSQGASTVVLCDGIGCDGFIWKYIEPQLIEAGFSVLRWHYRGHGRSAAPRVFERVAMADLCEDLATVMDDAEVETAYFAGHSMGVQLSLEFHRRYRYRSRAMVLLCGAPSEPLKTFKGSNLLETLLPTLQSTVGRAPGLFSSIGRALLPRDWIYDLVTKFELNSDHISRQDFMPYLKGVAQLDPTVFLAMLAEAGKHDARDFLHEIRVPTLVVGGQLDTFTPPDLSREMAAEIPGAELLIVEEGTHTAPLEHPDLVGDVLLDFYRRIPEQRSA